LAPTLISKHWAIRQITSNEEGYVIDCASYYISDYQLKSACKDAICIAPSKVT